MNQNLSILSLVLHASLVVQLVMAGLMFASLASWTVIFGKLFGLKKVRSANEEFEREFWAGKNLNELFAEAGKRKDGSHMERIFATGMREFLKLRERRVADSGALLDGSRRAMRASFQRELDTIESNLSFLASVGSVSPYVGLFGPPRWQLPLRSLSSFSCAAYRAGSTRPGSPSARTWCSRRRARPMHSLRARCRR